MGKKVLIVKLALILLAVALPASAQIQTTSLEIRGTEYDASGTAGSFTGGSAVWTPQSFAGFYYGLNDNLGTETLNATVIDESARKIPKDSLVYTTTAQPKMLNVVSEQYNSNATDAAAAGLNGTGAGQAFEGGNYYIIGWQAEPYVALNGKVDKLAKLVIEQGTAEPEKMILHVGETWNVGGGWALTVNSINNASTPRQVNLSLSKDGVKKDDKVVSAGASSAKPIYTYTENIANETDVPLFVTYVDGIIAGTPDYVQLRYTWAVSTNVTQIKSSDTYGIFKDAAIDQSVHTLSLKNTDTDISLTMDTIQSLMGKLKFRVAGNYILRFYPIVTYIDLGTYDVRGTVYDANGVAGSFTGGSAVWMPQNFAGFYYDLNDNLGTETLNATVIDEPARKIPKDSLVYTTTAQPKMLKVVSERYGGDVMSAASAGLDRTGAGQAFYGGYYYIIGWQAEPYVALNSKVDKLSKLIIEQGSAASEKKTLQVGETWNIGDGWALIVNSIDAKATPRQVWITLSKDGVKKDDKVIWQGGIYTYTEKSLAGETDVPLFVTYVDSVFAGATSDMVQLRYTWAVSTNVTQIRSSDTYGVFKDAAIDQVAHTLSLKNTDTDISLTRDSIQNLMGNMKFLVADNYTLRFYPFVTYEVVPPPPPPPPPQPFDTLRFEPNAWNLVSTPKTLVDPAVDISFDNLSSDMNNVKWFYDISENISTWGHPNNILPLNGYWVYNNASSVVLQKLMFKNMSGPNVPPSTVLKAGWNLIGHTAIEPMPVESALISINGKYSHILTYDPIQGWKMYIVGNPSLQQFNVFEPGRGYWIFMTQDATYAAVSV